MKKVISLTLALMMGLTLVACSNDTANTVVNDEENVTVASTSSSILAACNLSEDDVKVTDATVEVLSQTAESYSANVKCKDGSFESFEAYLNAFADICKAASIDGKLYEDELSGNEVEFNLQAGSINICQFVYKLSGTVVYVTVSEGSSEDGAFGLLIQKYKAL